MNSNLELLPKGQFIIKDEKQAVKGRFSMYVLSRFCEEMNIENFLTLLEKIMVGLTVRQYATLVLLAIQDYHRNTETQGGYTLEYVMDVLIDDVLDGMASKEFRSLIEHAVGRVANLKAADEADAGVDQSKTKKEALQKKRG